MPVRAVTLLRPGDESQWKCVRSVFIRSVRSAGASPCSPERDNERDHRKRAGDPPPDVRAPWRLKRDDTERIADDRERRPFARWCSSLDRVELGFAQRLDERHSLCQPIIEVCDEAFGAPV